MEQIKGILSGVFGWCASHKKTTIALVSLLVFISLLVIADKYTESKEASANENSEEQGSEENTNQTEYDKEQQRLVEKYGEPKEGFRWTEDGALQALGEADKTSEDVAFIYVRSLSTLDFANAQRYGYKTQTINTYTGYYDQDEDFSYNKGFESDMYKQVLLSMEPLNVVSTATFANFKEVITLEVNMLDLTNKDFWRAEEETLFKELKKYRLDERDTTKMKEFIYNYVLSYYTSKDAKTRTVSLDFTLEQTIDGAWLVTNDSDLDAIAQYQDGETVVNDILSKFDDWVSSQDDEVLNEEVGTDSSADELLDKDDGTYVGEEEGIVSDEIFNQD